MPTDRKLPFDPIDRAGDIWSSRIGESTPMKLATSIMRVQQLILAELDAALKPYDITFARYEVLVLISFSSSGSLPLSKIGERLMVHPTSVTNAIDRLEDQGLVRRLPDADDRRRTLAKLTTDGKKVLSRATKALMDIDFAVDGLSPAEQDSTYQVLRQFRVAAGDFDA